MTYSWSATGGTLASTIGESVTWTAPTAEGTYAVVVTVSDTASNQTQEILNIVVKAEVDPPVIDSVSATTPIVKSNDSTVICTAHDPNNLDLTYAWSASYGSFGDATSATTTWTAPATAGQYKLIITVSNERYSTVGNVYVTVTD